MLPRTDSTTSQSVPSVCCSNSHLKGHGIRSLGWLVIDAGLFAAVSLPDLVARIPSISPAHHLSLLAGAAIAGLWLTGVSEGRVRTVAFAYAEPLMAACDGLSALKQTTV